VGEVRGEEAYVLFQALATGHGGLCTMHADDVETAIKRLTQPPMNIPQSILSLMNCVIVVKQVKTLSINTQERKLSSRRFVKIAEIDDNGVPIEVFNWNMSTDTFQQTLGKSYLFTKIAKNLDAPLSVVEQEFERRKQILLRMVEKNLRDFRSVHKALNSSLNLAELAKEPSKEQR
jgi:flagellar protein FlaI